MAACKKCGAAMKTCGQCSGSGKQGLSGNKCPSCNGRGSICPVDANHK